jgi:hypothetical protein
MNGVVQKDVDAFRPLEDLLDRSPDRCFVADAPPERTAPHMARGTPGGFGEDVAA